MNALGTSCTDGPEPLILGPVGPDWVRRYAEASLDFNPIHLSQGAAEAAGLGGPVVHGMLIMGQFERLLRNWRPECVIELLSAHFLKPLPVGGHLEIAGRIVSLRHGGICHVRLTARDPAGDFIAAGEARVRVAP